MWGKFDPLKDHASGNQYGRFDDERDLIDHIGGGFGMWQNKIDVYLRNRDKREAKWYAGKLFQDSLRMTLLTLRVEERRKRKASRITKGRYTSNNIRHIETPPEMSALFDIVMKG